jgi:hypothetical protein
MSMMAKHDYLAMRSCCGEHPEECACPTIIGGYQQVVADDRQGSRAYASFDRTQPQGKV